MISWRVVESDGLNGGGRIVSDRSGIDAAYAREMLACLPVEGGRAALLEAGLDEAAVSPGATLDPDRYSALHHAVIRRSDDEMFGLFARALPRGTFAALIEVLVRVRTMNDAICATVSMYRVFSRRPAWAIEVDGGRATIALTAIRPATPLYVHISVHMVHRAFEWLAGVPVPVRRVELHRDLAAFATQTETLLGCPPHLGDRCAWSVDAELLHMRVVRRPEEVGPWLRGSLAALVRPPEAPTIVDRVRRVLGAVEPAASLDLPATAQRLAMSRATLARKLRAQGASFQGIKDALRRDVAMATLARRGTVDAAAAAAGFSDARAFRRAFKAWTGLSPGAWVRRRRDRPRR